MNQQSDASMDAEQLQAKYGGQLHPNYNADAWQAACAKGEDAEFNGYWDWVADQLIKDQPKPEETNVITNTDQFASLVARWHIHGMKQAEHMMEIPEGYEAEYEPEGGEPRRIVLEGDLLIAFRMGIMTGADAFSKLPFTYSLDEAAGDDDGQKD